MTQKKRQLSHFLNFYVFLTVELPVTIEKLEQVKEQQQQIQTKVQELGYENAVEISDGTCRITLYNCEENKDTVNQVMNAAYGVVKENYLLEVTFKTS